MTDYDQKRLEELRAEVARRQAELDSAKKKLRAFEEYLSIDLSAPANETTEAPVPRKSPVSRKQPVKKKERVGDRPPLKDSIHKVLHEASTAQQILNRLRDEDLMPDSSDPIAYIRTVLASNPALFLRVPGQRGFYARVTEDAPPGDPKLDHHSSATSLLSSAGVDLPSPAPSF